MKNLLILLVSLFFIHFSESFSQNFWEQATGPHYGSPNDIVINSRGDVFAATGAVGVKRLVAGGGGWTTVLPDGGSSYITLDVDDNIYVCNSSDVSISYDNGTSWMTTQWRDYSEYHLRATSIMRNSNGDIFFSAGGSFYSGDKNGVYRSSDGGNTWNHVGLAGQDVYSLYLENNGDILAGTRGEIYRSCDDGITWECLADDSNFGGKVRSIAINSQGLVFLGINDTDDRGGLFISADSGDTWVEKAVLGSPSFNDITIDTSDTILAATSMGLWKSNDNAESWTEIGQELPNPRVLSIALAQGGVLYAGADGVHRSLDHGLSWNQTSSPNGTIRALAAHPTGYIFGSNVRYAPDGNHWDALDITGGISSIVIDNSGAVFAAGWSISRSIDNGHTWTRIPIVDLPTRVDVRALATHPNGDIYAGSYGSGLFRSNDKGDTWILADSTLANHLFIRSLIINSSGYIFAGTYYNGLHRSMDGGQTWSQINNGLSDIRITVESFGINSNGVLFAGSWDDGVYRSEDHGDSWLQVFSPRLIQSLVVDINDHIYIGTHQEGIHRSTDGGSNWHPLNAGLYPESVRSLTIDSNGFMFAGVEDHGLYRSTQSIHEAIVLYMYPGDTNNDGQVNMDDLSTLKQFIGVTGPSRIIETSSWMPQPQTDLWVPFEAFYADCDGNGKVEGKDVVAIIENWQATQIGVGVPTIEKKAVCQKLLDDLNSAPSFIGRREIKMAIYNYMEGSLGVIFDYKLHQNYPNPFNQSTKIRFNLPVDPNEVSFQVYDIRGRLVWHDEIIDLHPGENEVVWSGQDNTGFPVASGIYLYILSSEAYTMSKRMVLLK